MLMELLDSKHKDYVQNIRESIKVLFDKKNIFLHMTETISK